MRTRPGTKTFLLLAVLAALALSGAAFGVAASASGGQPLVYICPDTQGHPSACAHGQELEVFDRNGAPIWSVGQTGGDAVFGDNRSVYPPGSVFSPAVTESYTDPVTYARTFRRSASCRAPAIWIAPHGIWTCSNGTWVRRISL